MRSIVIHFIRNLLISIFVTIKIKQINNTEHECALENRVHSAYDKLSSTYRGDFFEQRKRVQNEVLNGLEGRKVIY